MTNSCGQTESAIDNCQTVNIEDQFYLASYRYITSKKML